MFEEFGETTQELLEKDKEILELSLKVQRKQIQVDLLEAITFDNLMPWIVATTDGIQDSYTTSTVIHIVRKTIRRLTDGED